MTLLSVCMIAVRCLLIQIQKQRTLSEKQLGLPQKYTLSNETAGMICDLKQPAMILHLSPCFGLWQSASGIARQHCPSASPVSIAHQHHPSALPAGITCQHCPPASPAGIAHQHCCTSITCCCQHTPDVPLQHGGFQGLRGWGWCPPFAHAHGPLQCSGGHKRAYLGGDRMLSGAKYPVVAWIFAHFGTMSVAEAVPPMCPCGAVGFRG